MPISTATSKRFDLLTAIGNDPVGEFMLNFLQREGVGSPTGLGRSRCATTRELNEERLNPLAYDLLFHS